MKKEDVDSLIKDMQEKAGRIRKGEEMDREISLQQLKNALRGRRLVIE